MTCEPFTIKVRSGFARFLSGRTTMKAGTRKMDTLSSPRMAIALRISTAIFAGYGFTWGFIAAATAGLFALGMAFHDAEHLSAIFGLVIYLCAFLWSFAARSLGRVWAVLVGGGAAMAIAASLLQRHLI